MKGCVCDVEQLQIQLDFETTINSLSKFSYVDEIAQAFYITMFYILQFFTICSRTQNLKKKNQSQIPFLTFKILSPSANDVSLLTIRILSNIR